MPLALVLSSPSQTPSTGARLVTTDGRELPLRVAHLRAEAAAGIARTVVEQTFTNPHADALAVTYSLPLPADGAVSGFAFRVGDTLVRGEVHCRGAAREQFERALIEGRSAALLEQDRSSLFTQEIGNIPPGATVVAEITVDQPLRWLDEGAWEWRFPTVVSPRYLGAEGRVEDAARVVQDVAEGPIAARFTLVCTVGDTLAEGRIPESPSHVLKVEREGTGEGAGSYRAAGGTSNAGQARAVTLRIDDGARLDRDVVVRWNVAAPRVGVSLQIARPPSPEACSDRAFALLTLVPPVKALAPIAAPYLPRDLVVLLDTSGSMDGEPLAQARRVVSALIDTLCAADQLEMVEFSNDARRWQKGPVAATESAKKDAFGWLQKLRARGSTEMVNGILEAMSGLREGAQRQVVVVTDGQIGFESRVIAAICDRLPASSRLHTVGVGSAVNRSLTGPAARAGRGIEVILGLGEDPERAAARLVARTTAPLVVNLSVEGSALLEHAPRRLPDLFAGAPALVSVALRPEGGDLIVRGRTTGGTWEQRVPVGPVTAGTGSTGVVALFGRETIEDAELAIAAGGDRRERERHIEQVGLTFQLATRLTSWIAVSREITVDPRGALLRERMPHELPFGVSAEGLGLRPAAGFGDGAPPDAVVRFSLSAPLSAPRRTIGMKARLGKTAVSAAPNAAPSDRPSAGPRIQQTIRVEVSEELEYALRSRKSNVLGALPLLALIAFPIAYYLLRSVGLAIAIAIGVFVVALVIRTVLRRLLG